MDRRRRRCRRRVSWPRSAVNLLGNIPRVHRARGMDARVYGNSGHPSLLDFIRLAKQNSFTVGKVQLH